MMELFYEVGFWILISGVIYGLFYLGTMIYEKYIDKNDDNKLKLS